MQPARFRNEAEHVISDWAFEALYVLDRIATRASPTDPLRDASVVACRVLELALTSSPLRRVDSAYTVMEERLIPRGRHALTIAADVTPRIRQHLDLVRSTTFFEKGTPAEKRRELIRLIVHQSRELHAELSSKPPRAKRRAYKAALQTLLTATDEKGLSDLPFFGATVRVIIHVFAERYRIELVPRFVSRAVLACAQRAERGSRPGRLPRGAINHMRELEGLIVSAGLPKSHPQGLRDEYRAANASYAKEIAKKGYRRLFMRSLPLNFIS